MQLNLSEFQCVALLTICGIFIGKYLLMYLTLKRIKNKTPLMFLKSHPDFPVPTCRVEDDGSIKAVSAAIIKKKTKNAHVLRHPSTHFKHSKKDKKNANRQRTKKN